MKKGGYNKMLNKGIYKFIHSIFIIFFLLSSHIYAQEQNVILNEIIKEALDNNPQIKAIKSKVESFMTKPSQEGALEDPTLKLGITNLPLDTFSFGDEDMTQKEIALGQKFPFPGKLALKKEIAEKDVVFAEKEYEEKKNEITEEVKKIYFEIFFIDKSSEIAENNKKLLEEFVHIAEAKYSVGSGIQQDVLKAHVQISKALEELITLKQKRTTSESRLNLLLNRSQGTPVGKIPEITKTDFNLSADDLMSLAVSRRPFLKSLLVSVEREESSYKLARRDYYPDFDVEVGYGQRDGGLNAEGKKVSRPDMVSLSVSMNLPVYYASKQNRKVAETLANIDTARETYNAAKNDIFFNIKDRIAEIEKGNKLLSLYSTGIIPQTKQTLESSISNYQVNKVDFLTLLDNQITLFNYETEYYGILTDYEKKIAELETLVGGPLF